MTHAALPAIVLIGEPEDPVARRFDAPARGLITVHGRPLLQILMGTLRECGCEVVVVGNESLGAAVAQTTDARFVAAPSGLADKLRSGCEALGWPAKVLMCAADSPLVSAQGLQQLMDDVVQRDLELGYPIVPREDCEARFPGGHRTYVKMRDGVFTGGNFLVLSGAIVRDRSEWIDRFFEARKSPFRLASLLGWKLVLRMFLGGVTVAQTEDYFTRRFGLRAAAVVCHDAGMGFDVDKPEDLELMVRITA